MLHVEQLRDRCQGKWRGILIILGLDERYLSGKNGPCPWCEGKDRWRFINAGGSGNWVCNQCGRGDGPNLVMRHLGVDFASAAKRVEAVLGDVRPEHEKPRDEISDAAMKRMWDGAVSITRGSPGWRYFERRGLAAPDRLRYAANGASRAILAKIATPTGRCASLYRIFVARDGSKAPIEKPKMALRRRIPTGSAVRLCPIASPLGIAEGIENALSVVALFGVPCWATLGTGAMESFVVPSEVQELVIFADNDLNFAGQKAAFVRANKAVALDKIRCRVEIPGEAGADWNDVLMRHNGMGLRDAS